MLPTTHVPCQTKSLPWGAADNVLGFFTIPMHPVDKDRRLSLLYAGKDWADRELGRRSMILMAEKLMPGVDAGMPGRTKAAE
jgi:hypothetical protein